jgi:hypothetical protein
MNTTRVRRAKYVATVSLITGLAACSFPIVTRAEAWHKAFAKDHDADFLLDGVTEGFRYQFFDPEPDGAFYKVPNYVPDVHVPKVAAWVAAETAAGRYAPIHKTFARGFAALGVVDKDNSNMAKDPKCGSCTTFPGPSVLALIWASPWSTDPCRQYGTRLIYFDLNGSRLRLTLPQHTDQYRPTLITGRTNAWSGTESDIQIYRCLSAYAQRSRSSTVSLKQSSERFGRRESLQPWDTSMTFGCRPKLRKSAVTRIPASSNFCLTSDLWLTRINASHQRRA